MTTDNYHLIGKIQLEFMNSVFTHLLPEQIEQCLERIVPRCGTFFASFNRGRERYGKPHKTRADERSICHYEIEDLRRLAGPGVSVSDMGDYGHPRGQQMAKFREVR